MLVSGVNISAISTSVWSQSQRTLTALSVNLINLVSVIHASLANGAGADLRPSGTKMRDCRIVGEALANVTWVQTMFDGTTVRSGPAAASGAAVDFIAKGSNTFGPSLNNNGTVAGNYNVAGFDWLQ